MTQRERLIELLKQAFYNADDNYGTPNTEQVADNLLENGVIVPPVKVGGIVEGLQERISYLEESIDCSRKECNKLLQKLQQAKSEAIKEFARELKCGVPQETGIIRCKDIDTLVKEMTEGNNDRQS